MGIIISGADEVAAAFQGLAVELPAAVATALEGYGDTLADAVRSHASGRPGPEIQTGEYVGSIGVVTEVSGPDVTVEVGTDQPQGWRLEMGFVGADSLGRVYDAPAYPHFGPAVDETEPALTAAIDAAIGLP